MYSLAPTIFAGTASISLSTKIAADLNTTLGKIDVGRFSDGEIRVEVNESVRGKDVFVIQSTNSPVNDNLMELLVIVDALKRAHAKRVVAVIPYYSYSRQDRRIHLARTPITSKLAANLIKSAGVDYVITVDIHSLQQQGFFEIPFTSVSASMPLVADMWKHYYEVNNTVVVSPDVGGVARARSIAKQLDDAPLAIVDKRRPKPGESQVMNIIGDVEGKRCIIVDDMIDTGGTLANAAKALKDRGALSVVAYATHGIFSGNAKTTLSNSVIDKIVVTDTIDKNVGDLQGKLAKVSVADLIAETILRVYNNRSVSDMYIDD